MIKKQYSNVDVVTMAKTRIKNIFKTASRIELSVSGGKDSICLNDLIFKLCQSGEIDKSKLIVDFIDEEAIYPCVEKQVKSMRLQWLSIGVPFNWWCIQVKHYNCLNQLANDESFICWDETKKDVWIRQKPKFAITNDPLLDERHDTYQKFMYKKNKNCVSLIGVRASESIQRSMNLASRTSQEKMFPIYDWTDKDVWMYIRDNNLEFPDAYKFMYQVGIPINRLRISQFFSIDTIRSLVNMCEFYPGLFDKICKREPNAYMAMLYYDTELFRRQKKNKQAKKDEEVDYKEKFFGMMKEEWRFDNKSMQYVKKRVNRILIKYAKFPDFIVKKVSSYKGIIVRKIESCNIICVKLNSKSIERLLEYPEIQYICLDQYLFLCGMSVLSANKIRLHTNTSLSGKSVGIGVVDTGVYPHKDLTLPQNRIHTFVDLINSFTNSTV